MKKSLSGLSLACVWIVPSPQNFCQHICSTMFLCLLQLCFSVSPFRKDHLEYFFMGAF